MSVIDSVLEANRRHAEGFDKGHLAMPPRRKLAVVACMDARLTVEEMLGLDTGDAHIVRNAGGIVTDDALRSLVISHHLLGTEEFMVINHTDCGMLTFDDADLLTRLESQSGQAVVAPDAFHAFDDVAVNVRRQVRKVRSHPWIPDAIPVRGFVYDVATGRLEEIQGAE